MFEKEIPKEVKVFNQREEGYTFFTDGLMKFTFEYNIDGVDGEEEEAIIIDDDSLLTELNDDKYLLTSSETSKLNTESPQAAHRGEKPKSFRSFRTYELSEEGKSQSHSQNTFKNSQKDSAKVSKRRKNTQALVVCY